MPQDAVADLDRAASIRLLIRWIQHEGGLSSQGGSARLEDIAEALDLSRTQLNRFLQQELNTTEEVQRADEIAQRLRPRLDKRKDLPFSITRLLEDLYGPPDIALPKDAVVTDLAVVRMRSMMANEAYSDEHVTPVFGLSLLIRQSNELVRTGPDTYQRGWSLSLLNMPPSHIQRGAHHPVFRLTQTSLAGTSMTIQGIALARRDRLTLQGIETQQRRSFTASVALPDDDGWTVFHNSEAPLNGVMLGLSSSRANFACLFELFKVPGSTLDKNASGAAKERFRALYNSAREATGVRNLEETVTILNRLGIKASEAHLLRLKQRGDDSPLLSLF